MVTAPGQSQGMGIQDGAQERRECIVRKATMRGDILPTRFPTEQFIPGSFEA
jgi:hypothetical protein